MEDGSSDFKHTYTLSMMAERRGPICLYDRQTSYMKQWQNLTELLKGARNYRVEGGGRGVPVITEESGPITV